MHKYPSGKYDEEDVVHHGYGGKDEDTPPLTDAVSERFRSANSLVYATFPTLYQFPSLYILYL